MADFVTAEEFQENLQTLTYANYMNFSSPRYKAVMAKAKQLNKFIQGIDADEPMTEKGVTEFYKYMQEMEKAAEDYLDGKTDSSQKSISGKLRYKAVKELLDLTRRRMEQLDLETSADQSVTQVLTDAQRKKLLPESMEVVGVTVSEQKAGANSSSRIKVLDGEGKVSGFFTPDVQMESEIGLYRNFRKANQEHYEKLYANHKGLESLKVRRSFDGVDFVESDLVLAFAKHLAGSDTTPDEDEKLAYFTKLYLEAKYPADREPTDVQKSEAKAEAEAVYKDDEFQKLFSSFSVESSSLKKQKAGGAGLAVVIRGAQIARHNVAMSRIADMIGTGDIVARSRMAETTINGIRVKGCIMDKAVGADCLDEANRSLFDEPTSYSSKALQSITEVGILDIICGNIDRHTGNLLYSFERDEEGYLVMTGIQGIDNDASFGTINMEVTGVHFVSDRMAKALLVLDKDTFTANLNGLLTTAQIERSWKRVEKLRQMVADKETLPLKESEWGEWFTSPLGLYEKRGDINLGQNTIERLLGLNHATLPEKIFGGAGTAYVDKDKKIMPTFS